MHLLERRPSPTAFILALLPFVAGAVGAACSSSSSSSSETGGEPGSDGGTTNQADGGTTPKDSGAPAEAECKKNEDCASKVCNRATGKCSAATCSDGAQNQNETDIDCGGTCGKCDVQKACKVAADCQSGVCSDGGTGLKCQPASCTDTVKNGAETDVDCGGAACAKCIDTKSCKTRDDCVSDVCVGGKCITPVCNDGAKNGSETDIDCGGPGCPRCGDNLACNSAGDCLSGVCTGNVCQPPACPDGIKNGNETDVDCGGPGCPGCATGLSCKVGSDCASQGCRPNDSKCAAGRSCTQRYGGDTCGLGGEGGRGAEQWEDCCTKAPVTPTTGPTAGQTIMLDKYQVTAGRMRVFLESINYDVRAFVKQARVDGKIPLIPLQTGSNAGYSLLEESWDMYLPVSFAGTTAGEISGTDQGGTTEVGMYSSVRNHLGGRIFQGNEQSSTGCYVGGPGTHAFRFSAMQDGATPAQSQEIYDTKSMQCIDYMVAQAFCIWDGGRLLLVNEFAAAWGAAARPWGANPEPQRIGDNTYWGCRFPWVDDATYPNFCVPPDVIQGPTATRSIEYAAYRYSYEWPVSSGGDYISFISAPGRTRGRGPAGHADIIGTNMSITSDLLIGTTNATATNATNGSLATYDGTPKTVTHRWAQSGSWEVHDPDKNSGSWRTFLLNKYGKLGLRCAYPN